MLTHRGLAGQVKAGNGVSNETAQQALRHGVATNTLRRLSIPVRCCWPTESHNKRNCLDHAQMCNDSMRHSISCPYPERRRMPRIVSQGSPACRSLFWLWERSPRMHLVSSPVRHVTWGACRAGAGGSYRRRRGKCVTSA